MVAKPSLISFPIHTHTPTHFLSISISLSLLLSLPQTPTLSLNFSLSLSHSLSPSPSLTHAHQVTANDESRYMRGLIESQQLAAQASLQEILDLKTRISAGLRDASEMYAHLFVRIASMMICGIGAMQSHDV